MNLHSKQDFYSSPILKPPRDNSVFISPRAIALSQKYNNFNFVLSPMTPPCEKATPTEVINITCNKKPIKEFVGPIKGMEHLSIDNIFKPSNKCNSRLPVVHFEKMNEKEKITFSMSEVKTPNESRLKIFLGKEKAYVNHLHKYSSSHNYLSKSKLPKIKLTKFRITKPKSLSQSPAPPLKSKNTCKFRTRKKNNDDTKFIEEKIKEFTKTHQRKTIKLINRFKKDIVEEDYDFYINIMKEVKDHNKLHSIFIKQPGIQNNYFTYQAISEDEINEVPMALSDSIHDRMGKV